MKLDIDTKEVMKELIANNTFDYHKRSIDISKFLDENKQLDLWFLEVAVSYSIRFMTHALGKPSRLRNVTGIQEYCDIREVKLADMVSSDEFMFFTTFIDRIAEQEINTG